LTGSKIAFIGFSRPIEGGVPGLSEMTARHFAQVSSNRIQLPKDLKSITHKENSKEKRLISNSERTSLT